MIYYPSFASGEIWSVPRAGGTPERFAAGLSVPTAVKFDQKGMLAATQAGNGEVAKFDIQSGAKTTIAKVRPGIDNFAIDANNHIFISHFIDGGVAEILENGQERVLVAAGLVGPFGLALGSDGTVFAGVGMGIAATSPDGRPYSSGVVL